MSYKISNLNLWPELFNCMQRPSSFHQNYYLVSKEVFCQKKAYKSTAQQEPCTKPYESFSLDPRSGGYNVHTNILHPNRKTRKSHEQLTSPSPKKQRQSISVDQTHNWSTYYTSTSANSNFITTYPHTSTIVH